MSSSEALAKIKELDKQKMELQKGLRDELILDYISLKDKMEELEKEYKNLFPNSDIVKDSKKLSSSGNEKSKITFTEKSLRYFIDCMKNGIKYQPRGNFSPEKRKLLTDAYDDGLTTYEALASKFIVKS